MTYISEGILIEKTEIRDREKSYLILSKDFGKMRWFYKESPKSIPCDVGNIIEISIERKWEVNKIKSCRPKQSFRTENLGFESLHKFLLILAFCKKQLPDGGGDGVIYQELTSLIRLSENHNPEHVLFLGEARLLSLFQNWPESMENEILIKMRELSAHNSIKELTKITGIPKELYEITHLYFLQSQAWTNLSM
jgi:recombinational DNA repair protein (RecF pathway)